MTSKLRIIFSADNSEDALNCIEPTNFNCLLFTKDYPKLHELEKYWG